MKKTVIETIAVVFVACLILNVTGCSSFKSYRLPGKNKKATVDKQLEILLEAIEDEDVDAIIDMFSKEALEEIEDADKMDEFEASIETLIDTFPDWDGEYDGYNDLTIREYKSYSRDNTSFLFYYPDFSFVVDGVKYELHMVMIYRADEEERVGLRAIQICHEDASGYTTAGFYSKPGMEVFPGVYCWDCKIENREKRYK